MKTFGLLLEGFQPLEKCTFYSRSYNEEITEPIELSKDGSLAIMLSPAVIGKKGGVNRIEIRRDNEMLTLQFDWGTAALKENKIIGHLVKD